MKKVSIYIPTKNRVSSLKKAVESVIEQTYENWELLIVNDASEDGTQIYLDELTKLDKRIKVYHNKMSQGACSARNIAIFEATGEFITGLDDDDLFKKNRLSTFIDNWKDEEKNVIALCTYKDISINGKVTEVKNKDLLYVTLKNFFLKNRIGNQVFTKTKLLQDIKGFDPDFKMWQDYECWYRLVKSGGSIKKLDVATYIWDNNERTDRITNSQVKKVFETYETFVSKNNLTSKQATLLKLTLLDYNVIKLNAALYMRLLFYSFSDYEAIRFINKIILKPQIYKILKFFKIK